MSIVKRLRSRTRQTIEAPPRPPRSTFETDGGWQAPNPDAVESDAVQRRAGVAALAGIERPPAPRYAGINFP